MEDRPAKEGVKMKEQSPSINSGQAHSFKETAARALGVGLVVGAGTLPDTRLVQASEVQKHIDSPNKHELYLEQGMPSANALMEAGFQIGGEKNPEVQSHSTPGVENVGTSVRVETSQTITETFSNLLVSKEQREQNPVQIYDMFLEENAQGEVQSMYFIARYQNSEGGGDSGISRYIYKTQLDTQTGKFSKAAAISKELPIAALTIAISGQKKLIGGENPIRSANPALLLTEDDGQTFTPITTHIRQGVINESQIITGTNQAMLNIFGFETSGSLENFDFNSESLTKINWNLTGVTTRDALALAPFGQNTTEIYATTYDGVLSSGYLKITANLSTGQATGERKRTEWGYLDAFFQLKNNNGQVTHALGTNNDRQSLYIDNFAANTSTEMPYYNWLDAWAQANGITNYDPGSLRLKHVQVVNNTVWAMGFILTTDNRGARSVALSWLWGENPNTNPNALTIQRFPHEIGVTVGQKNVKWGKFSGKSGFLLFRRSLGLVFLETDLDGKPLPNPAILNIDNGMGELPPPPPIFKIFIPVVNKSITSSWRKKEFIKRLRKKIGIKKKSN